MQVLSIPKMNRIHAVRFSPDGQSLAAACGDDQLRVWDLRTGKVETALPIPVNWTPLFGQKTGIPSLQFARPSWPRPPRAGTY